MIRSVESYLESMLQSSDLESAFPESDPMESLMAYREAEIVGQFERMEPVAMAYESVPVRSTSSIGEGTGQISDDAYNLIIAYETGGRAYYEKKYKNAPCWPGYFSGITIGFGFDLGYYSRSEFESAWGNHLSSRDMSRLERCLGFKTSQPDREAKVEQAKRWIRQFENIRIPWSMGETVFNDSTIPKNVGKLHRYLPNAADLPAHCFGALLSLVFNRGASFRKEGQRYREMRAIRKHLIEGVPERIPAELRSMKRLWPGSSLATRREEEAKLFERGLSEETVSDLGGLSDVDPAFQSWSEDIASRDRRSGVAMDWRRVRWVRHDENHPDYRHIAGLGQGEAAFDFIASDLELLIEANEFQPVARDGVILFALRGCRLIDGSPAIEKESLRLTEERPDHRHLRCVVGVYHQKRGRLSAFSGSTVPNARFVWDYTISGKAGNLLPTGCYRYRVGSQDGEGDLPRLFLDEAVLVLRTGNDCVYGTKDRWERGKFRDDIHPTFGRFDWGEFSSAGAITVKGTVSGEGGAMDEWPLFEEAVGLRQDGERRDLVLLTGLEARIASHLRRIGVSEADDPRTVERLCRLRSGSRGTRVSRLQGALGVTVDGDFGSLTREALVKTQAARGIITDAIFSDETADSLGLELYPRSGDARIEENSDSIGIQPVVPALSDPSDEMPPPVTEFPPQGFESGLSEILHDEDDYIEEIFERPDHGFESTSRVYWPGKDINSPCYSHLVPADSGDDLPSLAPFELGADEMECLIERNRFVPYGKDDVIAFGIRGARFRFGLDKVERADVLQLKDARPDHRQFRCIVGLYFRGQGKFSAYNGSTVPWHAYMSGGVKNNLLPTGCYVYKVGEHRPGSSVSRRVMGLRLSNGRGGWKGDATVLRTKDDFAFGLGDQWDHCRPADNVHCAYSETAFSSAGCQTIQGGKGFGLWVDFQRHLLELGEHARVDYILLTGVDVAYAHRAIEGGRAVGDDGSSAFARLRAGSHGDEVKRLQQRLGIGQTGYFGAFTRFMWAEFQKANQLIPDAIYSPAMDEELGWSVFDGKTDNSDAPFAFARPLAPTPVVRPVAPVDLPMRPVIPRRRRRRT